MGLFNSRQSPPLPPPIARSESPIPISAFDVTKWYDIYYNTAAEELVYENVRFVAIRTFERTTEYSSGLLGGFLEIEAVDGSRILIQNYGIRLICEHGTRPMYRVLRQFRNAWEE